MRIFYRISDTGYNKVKPDYINNENCLRNFANIFNFIDVCIIADNVSEKTLSMIQRHLIFVGNKYESILEVNIGNGAGTFNVALDLALTDAPDDEIIYFVENDYIHHPDAEKILKSGFDMGADYVTLYDHPDKYINATDGGNPFVEDGGEVTKVFRGEHCHWKLTNSTTMTFAAKVKTLKEDKDIWKKWTDTSHPNDFQAFLELRSKGRTLISPLPGYATHGETSWLAPFIDWKQL